MRLLRARHRGVAAIAASPALAAGLAGPLCGAAGLMIWEANKRDLSALALNLIKCSIAAVLFLVVAVRQAEEIPPSSTRALFVSSMIGIVVGDMFWIQAFERLGTRTTALLGTAQPLLAALVGWAVLTQPITLTAVVGILLISVGLLVAIKEEDGEEEEGWPTVAGILSGIQEGHWDGHRRRGLLLAALSISSDLLGAMLTQQHAACLSTWAIGALRFGFASAALLALFLLARRYSSVLPPAAREWASLQAAPLPPYGRAQWAWIGAGCVLVTFAWSAFSAYALVRMPLGMWQALSALVPVHTILLHRLWTGKWSSRRAIAGAVLASVGAATLARGRHGHGGRRCGAGKLMS